MYVESKFFKSLSVYYSSGAVEIESQMSIDAFVTKGGLKMLTTLHTSTGARGKIEITNKNVLDMSFDYTKEKSEILNVQ